MIPFVVQENPHVSYAYDAQHDIHVFTLHTSTRQTIDNYVGALLGLLHHLGNHHTQPVTIRLMENITTPNPPPIHYGTAQFNTLRQALQERPQFLVRMASLGRNPTHMRLFASLVTLAFPRIAYRLFTTHDEKQNRNAAIGWLCADESPNPQ